MWIKGTGNSIYNTDKMSSISLYRNLAGTWDISAWYEQDVSYTIAMYDEEEEAKKYLTYLLSKINRGGLL